MAFPHLHRLARVGHSVGEDGHADAAENPEGRHVHPAADGGQEVAPHGAEEQRATLTGRHVLLEPGM